MVDLEEMAWEAATILPTEEENPFHPQQITQTHTHPSSPHPPQIDPLVRFIIKWDMLPYNATIASIILTNMKPHPFSQPSLQPQIPIPMAISTQTQQLLTTLPTIFTT